ncbi:hypothetical protein HNP46_000320 [Pseudomonas nitritireducens]|uniref:Large polyvalent protein associated domain-containing protein n=1 Tax=Pseudomonas nitroreducens TaxID=46680 RepID=A0A7W7KEU9_PSENT|nr:LPD29 domain-containing protein [Pseudomonas nitritireducens]MBB4861509.1 hypothetical protein [Pseudomonas nitritireducens]
MSTTPAPVVIGTRVYSGLYNRGPGVVYGIKGEQKPDSIRSIFGGVGAMGGNADFSIVFECGSLSIVPECILHGVQWSIEAGVADQAEIDRLLVNAKAVQAARVEASLAAKFAEAKAIEQLKSDKDFKHLIQVANDPKAATKNLRIELRRAYPGIKFSVRSSSGSTTIRWTDGPTGDEVNALVGRYEIGRFDGMQDLATTEETPFSKVFGGIKYLFTSRMHSDALVERGISAVFEEYAGNLRDVARPCAEDYNQGRLHYQEIPLLGDSLGTHVSRAIAKISTTH